jgi:hypothetical protein
MTLGEILDGMFRLLIRHWRVFLIALGVILIPFNILQAFLTSESVGSPSIGELVRNPDLLIAPAGGGNTNATTWLNILGLVSLLVVTPFTLGVACRIAAEGIEGGDPSTGGVWRSSLAKFWSLLGLTLLVVGIWIVVAIVFAVLLAFSAATGSPGIAVAAVVLILFGLAATGTYLSLSYPAMMVERLGPGRAVGRSLRLVRGRFWRTLGTLLLVIIIIIVVTFVAGFAFGLPGFAFGGQAAVIFALIGTTVGSLATTPLLTNAITLLYYDARVRDEGYDLDVTTDELGASTERPFG